MERTIDTLWDAVFFDFDGVLCDSMAVKGNAFGALYADEGPAAQQAMIRFHAENGGVVRDEKLRRFERDILGRPIDAARIDALVERFGVLVEQAVVEAPAIAGAAEFLERHAGRLPMFVVSATPHDELARIVQARGMAPAFVSVHGAPDRKADIVRSLLKRHGIDASRAVFVGDATVDFEAASLTGLGFVGVRDRDGHHPFPPGTLVIDDLRDLEPALIQLSARRPGA